MTESLKRKPSSSLWALGGVPGSVQFTGNMVTQRRENREREGSFKTCLSSYFTGQKVDLIWKQTRPVQTTKQAVLSEEGKNRCVQTCV